MITMQRIHIRLSTCQEFVASYQGVGVKVNNIRVEIMGVTLSGRGLDLFGHEVSQAKAHRLLDDTQLAATHGLSDAIKLQIQDARRQLTLGVE